MNNVIKSIHVGVAGRGGWPISLATADASWQPVALVDVSAHALENARKVTGLGEESSFGTLEAALEKVDADAVIVCTPTVFHAPVAEVAFAAGLHVLVEKGMTTSLAKAKELVNMAVEKELAFCVAQNYRFQPIQETMKKILDEETYGKPAILDLVHHRHRPNPRTLNYKDAMVWDMSCHHFDNLVFWLGNVKSAIARTYNTPWSKYEHDAGVSAVLEFECGVIGNYCLTHCAQNGFYHLLIQTDAGTLRAYDVQGIQFQAAGGGQSESVELFSVPQSEQSVLNAFRDYILEGKEPGISGRNNLNTLAVCQAVCDAAEEGKPIYVSELLGYMRIIKLRRFEVS